MIQTGTRGIVSWGKNSGGQKWTFRTDGDKIRVKVNGGYIVGKTSVGDGKWHQVAFTFDPGNGADVNKVRLYVDGEFDGNSSVQGQSINTAAQNDVMIGRAVINNRSMHGFMDEFMLFGRALNDGEIKGIYQMGMP